mmetsp:Transcript_94943/g.307055  ORF Transcript_94943/g.307055 Transcript_94943/m.307055 type:complete len:242 (-) Transcript_94943:3593-4318(-)
MVQLLQSSTCPSEEPCRCRDAGAALDRGRDRRCDVQRARAVVPGLRALAARRPAGPARRAALGRGRSRSCALGLASASRLGPAAHLQVSRCLDPRPPCHSGGAPGDRGAGGAQFGGLGGLRLRELEACPRHLEARLHPRSARHGPEVSRDGGRRLRGIDGCDAQTGKRPRRLACSERMHAHAGGRGVLLVGEPVRAAVSGGAAQGPLGLRGPLEEVAPPGAVRGARLGWPRRPCTVAVRRG